ncbi:hypothetical protein BJY04DRAFT_179939 [Aspergillus karnatakaensis]|uniref:uncharacterized protein n=1 Tax=Aspergillus karnatakaensis TaxID=1810916 RepID=UPI003CCD42A2
MLIDAEEDENFRRRRWMSSAQTTSLSDARWRLGTSFPIGHAWVPAMRESPTRPSSVLNPQSPSPTTSGFKSI